jgi:AcrR family transcriptional regulator
MATTGLRELKKARTRRLIADTAARLFAERGYERVAVSDVAREAEVAEQTVPVCQRRLRHRGDRPL